MKRRRRRRKAEVVVKMDEGIWLSRLDLGIPNPLKNSLPIIFIYLFIYYLLIIFAGIIY